MASMKCPGCGERVKVREGAERLRCRACGKSFRAPDEDLDEEAEDDRPRRRRKKDPAKKSDGVKVAAIAVGMLLLACVAVAVVLVARNRKSPGDSWSPSGKSEETI